MTNQSIKPLGEAALELKTSLVSEFLSYHQLHPISGVQEIIPALDVVVIFFDPLQVSVEVVIQQVKQLCAQLKPKQNKTTEMLVLPVRFDGPDLVECAQSVKMSRDEFIEHLTQVTLQVAFLGFLPGFAFLTGLPPKLQMPRRSNPRQHVPAKSVALGGPWAGVYPRDSAGGWQLIGSTEVVLFDLGREEPLWWQPGQYVRFEAVD